MHGDALSVGGIRDLFASIALIDVGQRHVLARDVLDGFGQAANFLAVPYVGGRDVEGQQMAECVDRHVDLGAALAFGTVIASPCAAFRC